MSSTCARVFAAIAVLFVESFFVASYAEPVVVRVDPALGVDSVERLEDGQAVRSVEFVFEATDASELEIHLAAGQYEGGDFFDGLAETLPWNPSSQLRSLRIVGPEGSERAAVRSVRDVTSIIAINLAGAEADDEAISPLEIELLRLDFRGGRGALEVVSPTRRNIELSVKDCHFESLAGSALHLASSGACVVRVQNSTFISCGSAVTAEALSGGQIEVDVEDNSFIRFTSSGPGSVPGGPIELHADGAAAISARIQSNKFQDVATAVTLTSHPLSSAFDVMLASNVIQSGLDDGNCLRDDACRPAHALYLSIWNADDFRLRLINNTFVGLSGPLLFEDNVSVIPAIGVSIQVSNNLFWGDVDRPIGEFASDASSLRAGVYGSHNGVPYESWLSGTEEPIVVVADPFNDFRSGDFGLTPASLLSDAGDTSLASEISVLDAAGRCRLAGVDQNFAIDLGAFETSADCYYGRFLRGDCAQNSSVEIGDAIALFSYLFLGGGEPLCLDACDSNDDGALEISDGIFTLTFLFLGGAQIPAPFPAAGLDPSFDSLQECR